MSDIVPILGGRVVCSERKSGVAEDAGRPNGLIKPPLRRSVADDVPSVTSLDASDGIPLTGAAGRAGTAIGAAGPATAHADGLYLVSVPDAAPAGRAAAGSVYVVRGPVRPDCSDDLPASDLEYSWTCDSLGELQTSIDSTTASRSVSATASSARRKCRSDRHGYNCNYSEYTEYGIRRSNVAGHVVAKRRYGSVLAEMYLRLSHISGGANFAIALTHVDGPSILPRLTYKCRLDIRTHPDKDCAHGPNDSKTAPAYMRRRFKVPKTAPASLTTMYSPARGMVPDYRFYEHKYEWKAYNKPNPSTGSGGWFSIGPVGKPFQTDRFICLQGARDSDPDFVECRFP